MRAIFNKYVMVGKTTVGTIRAYFKIVGWDRTSRLTTTMKNASQKYTEEIL